MGEDVIENRQSVGLVEQPARLQHRPNLIEVSKNCVIQFGLVCEEALVAQEPEIFENNRVLCNHAEL